MFDYMTQLVKERIQKLESESKIEDEIYLRVSCLDEETHKAAQALGWRITYVEQGIFQLSKI